MKNPQHYLVWPTAAAVAALLVIALTIASPIASIALTGTVALVTVVFLIPREKIIGVCGKIALSSMIVFPIQNLSEYGNLKYAVLGLMVLVLAVGILRRTTSLRLAIGGLWLFGLYFVVIALATPRSEEPSAWNLYLGILVCGAVPAILFALMTESERRSALNFLVWFAMLQSVYAVYEMLLNPAPIWGPASTNSQGEGVVMNNQIVLDLVRAQGTLGHPLPLALLMLVGLALALRGYGPLRAGLRNAAIVLLFVGCFAAGSRSALAVALVLALFGAGKVRWKAVVVGTAAASLGLLIAAANGLFESAAYLRFIASDSLSHRNGALEAVPNLLDSQSSVMTVFGNGFFSAYQLFRAGKLQDGNFFAVDNQFVMTLIEGGVVGVILLVGLLIRTTKRIDAASRLGFIAVVAFFLSFDVLSWPIGVALFGSFLGLSVLSVSRTSWADPEVSTLPKISGPDLISGRR